MLVNLVYFILKWLLCISIDAVLGRVTIHCSVISTSPVKTKKKSKKKIALIGLLLISFHCTQKLNKKHNEFYTQ